MRAVIAGLDVLGVSPVVVDLASLEDGRPSLIGEVLEVSGSRLRLGEARRGWIRRLAPPGWRREAMPTSHAGVVRASWVTMLTGICTSATVAWLTALTDLFVAENKLVQLRAARRIEIQVPSTFIVPDRGRIPAELGDQFVIKPLGPGAFTDEAGMGQVVFTRELRRDAPALDHLASAPFLIQERLDAQRHLRVVTVGRRAWVCSLDAPAELDWREDEDAHQAFKPSAQDAAVVPPALALVGALNIGYSSQDWVVTRNGEAFFLDLNPAGQWLFLPEPVASEVARAVAAWLAETSG